MASAAVVLSCSRDNYASGNGKKVYADYHGVRYTRRHDGKLGRWEMFADTYQSATGRKTLCYNADLIDSSGRHIIAAQAYPQVGMQSNLDEDYIEYQILSAKAAGIDGFFIEWGFLPHENDVLLRAMQKVAAEYGFEIGVNWCEAWLYYDWITKIYPEIDTREKKTDYMVKCYQYLIDSVFTGSTAPSVNGRPVFYRFGAGASGAGASVEEYKSVLSRIEYPEGMERPAVLLRWADWGRLEDGKYIPVTHSDVNDSWKAIGEIPTAWLPARVRPMDENYPLWDNYALPEDLIEFMKPFRDSIWLSDDPAYIVKSGFVMPGMDNRGCAGWGRGHFYHIPRNGGATYEDMWKFCMESKDSLDMIFIASWSDYTEGHEIEPTMENGDRELRTTLRYASMFKEEKCDSGGIALPLELFRLRKTAAFLRSCGESVSKSAPDAFLSSVDDCGGILDKAARAIADGRYRKAGKLLSEARKCAESLSGRLRGETVRADSLQAPVVLDESLVERLGTRYYTGYITFEYKDDGREYLFVRSSTDRQPAEQFAVVGKLRTDGSGMWKRAKIELFPENIAYREGSPAFFFSDGVQVRDIAVEYTIYDLQ